jgi:hypothetical protein
MWDYAALSKDLQNLAVQGGVGEPKFKTDASPFNDRMKLVFLIF